MVSDSPLGDTLRTVGGAPDDPSGEDDMHWSRTRAAGAAAKAVNLTGARVVLRSSAAKDEVCGPESDPVTESVILPGGRAEVKDACWCCAPSGNTCTPANKTGNGQAFLERCFE